MITQKFAKITPYPSSSQRIRLRSGHFPKKLNKNQPFLQSYCLLFCLLCSGLASFWRIQQFSFSQTKQKGIPTKLFSTNYQTNYFYTLKDSLDYHAQCIYLLEANEKFFILIREELPESLPMPTFEEKQKKTFKCSLSTCKNPVQEFYSSGFCYTKSVRGLSECFSRHRFHKECLQRCILEECNKKFSKERIMELSFNRGCDDLVSCPICKNGLNVDDLKRVFGIRKYVRCKKTVIEERIKAKLAEDQMVAENELCVLECCNKALEANPEKKHPRAICKEIIKNYVSLVLRNRYGNSLKVYEVLCPNCCNPMTEKDIIALYHDNAVPKDPLIVCIRCKSIFKDEVSTGKYQVLNCKKKHVMCAHCIHLQVIRNPPKSPGQFPYPVYRCTECEAYTELREIHAHDAHNFDLAHLVYQFTQYPHDSAVPCIDSVCANEGRKYDASIAKLMEGFVVVHEAEYDKNIYGVLTKEQIATLNIWLYRYYAEIIQVNEKRVWIRGYVHLVEKYLIEKLDITNDNCTWTLKKEICDQAKINNYPQNWDISTNPLQKVNLRPMLGAEQSYKEAESLLRKAVPAAKIKSVSMIQNPKQWQRYTYVKDFIGNEIFLAIVMDKDAIQKVADEKFLLTLIAKSGKKGRAVYLTIPEAAHKLVKADEQGIYKVVYAKVRLGEEDPDGNGSNVGYKDEANFLKYGHKRYEENGCRMYAVYGLSQVYPLYQVNYQPQLPIPHKVNNDYIKGSSNVASTSTTHLNLGFSSCSFWYPFGKSAHEYFSIIGYTSNFWQNSNVASTSFLQPAIVPTNNFSLPTRSR
eukprot:TRINITY_DN3724_c0_g1_i1.p1 TRINITY_DN3724_c0_g1~~TRINITY_DN3724_c0_g1_i1.p1  ORF type:complete len:806 (+),score=43.22 TRINITY_DN3724_c0_g1_i1:4796-7213(+)